MFYLQLSFAAIVQILFFWVSHQIQVLNFCSMKILTAIYSRMKVRQRNEQPQLISDVISSFVQPAVMT